MWQEKSSKEVSFLWKAEPFKQSATERLAEVNIPPALIRVRLHLLSNPAVKTCSRPELSKEEKPYCTKHHLVWLADSSLVHLDKDAKTGTAETRSQNESNNPSQRKAPSGRHSVLFEQTWCCRRVTTSVYSYFPEKLMCGNVLVSSPPTVSTGTNWFIQSAAFCLWYKWNCSPHTCVPY